MDETAELQDEVQNVSGVEVRGSLNPFGGFSSKVVIENDSN